MATLVFNRCTTVIHELCCINDEHPDTFESVALIHNFKPPPKHGSKPHRSTWHPARTIAHVQGYYCQCQLELGHGQSGRDHRLAEHHELQ
jgi:hypothetical protein